MRQPKSPRRSLFSRFLYFYNDLVMGVLITVIALICLFWFRRTIYWLDPLLTAIVLITIAVVLRVARNRMKIFIQEREFGIIFEKRGNFIEFVDSGTHFINPLYEVLKTKVSKKKLKAEGRMDILRTREGIPVTLFWTADYFLDVDYILKEQDIDQAYSLLNLPIGKIIGLTNNVIRDAVEQKNVPQLYEVQENEPLLSAFEAFVTDEINPILNTDPLFKEDTYKVKIGPILFPRPLETTLEEASKRYVWKHPFNLSYDNKN